MSKTVETWYILVFVLRNMTHGLDRQHVPGKSSTARCSTPVKMSPQEEEDASEEDINTKLDYTVTIKSDFNVRSFLDQLEDDADGFVSPVDDRIPSRGNQDMGLSNLHAASMYVRFLAACFVICVLLCCAK